MTCGYLPAALATVFALAACTRSPSAAQSDLQRDLDGLNAAKPELAPTAGRRLDVMSAVERAPLRSLPKAAAQGRQVPAPIAASPAVVATLPVERVDSASAAARPRPVRPVSTQTQRIYRTESEVIRAAPFPINP
ncbi:MAG: hypothetical protein NVS4B3_23340 [Gemmatimonadaceae bacterium]